ncbi:ABC transporter permease [Tropicimonas sp. TH_r6]|uniref:ABC transporter permease n=1 Tax=Tropicimonas sp. TH_r6 TaxID=3082085 RepID=UPI002954F37C|nr:ABC transporter permease [Tropicimonas sp. TH_r6]MDV7145579.1 ABC transporter permease [Tropicimonas sp. TH_r6]
MSSKFYDGQLGFLALVNAMVIVASLFLVGPKFVGLYSMQSMATQVSELGLLALGVMLAMAAGRGGIDLSGIALANLSGVIAFNLAPQFATAADAPMLYCWVFAAISIIVGILGGAINGTLVGYAGLTPIIATLGTQMLFTGIAVGLTGGSALRLGYIPPLDDFANLPVMGVPISFALFLGVAFALAIVLRYTKYGMRLFLLGSNDVAARYAGIPVRRMYFITYTIAGMLASVAGIIIAARTSSVKWDYGTSYVMVAILIAVMAGVRPEGGYGRVICVVISACALQLMSSLFNFMHLSNFFRDCAWGLLLLLFLAASKVDLSMYLRFRTPVRPGRA